MAEDIKKMQDILRKAEEWSKRKQEKGDKRYISSGAYWVSPAGDLRKVPGGIYHINDVIQNPDIFGYTKDQIQRTYDEYGEKFGQEGDARDSLMTNLLKDGWVRIRVRRNHYSIQVWDFNPMAYTKLENFVTQLVEDGVNGEYASENDEAKINALKSGKMKSVTFGEILKGYLYESSEHDIDYNYFTG